MRFKGKERAQANETATEGNTVHSVILIASYMYTREQTFQAGILD